MVCEVLQPARTTSVNHSPGQVAYRGRHPGGVGALHGAFAHEPGALGTRFGERIWRSATPGAKSPEDTRFTADCGRGVR